MAKKTVKNEVVENVVEVIENAANAIFGAFKVIKENAIDYVKADNKKTAASWVDEGQSIVCEFIRSTKVGDDWIEDSRARVLTVDVSQLSDAARDFCTRYGLKQIIADRNFAMGKAAMNKETERVRLNKAEAFLKELFETGKIPANRKKGLTPEQKKARSAMLNELSAMMKSRNWARVEQLQDEMEKMGFTLDN